MQIRAAVSNSITKYGLGAFKQHWYVCCRLLFHWWTGQAKREELAARLVLGLKGGVP